MGVRVRVLLRALIGPSAGSSVETTALANTGYETEEPEVLLPRPLAEHLGIPMRAPEARRAYYETPLGLFSISFVERAVEVELLGLGARAVAHAIISEHEREVLLSDKTIGALGIIILEPGEGLWRHKSDEPSKARPSARPEFW